MPSNTDAEPAVRKVQRTGGTTFTVSLPKDWARDQGLEAGSRVYVYSFEDRVVVAPTERPAADRRARIDVDGLDADAVARRIQSAYASGADTVVVRAEDGLDGEHRRAATDAVTGLVGLRVADEAPDCVAARSMLDPSAVSISQTVARLRQQTLTMLREAVDALVEADADLAATARGRRDEVSRLVALIRRQFQGALVDVSELDRLEGDRETAYRQLRTAHRLERVADAADRVAAVAADLDEAAQPPLKAALETAGERIAAAVRAGLDGDHRESVEAARSALADLEAALSTGTAPGGYPYGRVLEALALTTDAAEALATMPE